MLWVNLPVTIKCSSRTKKKKKMNKRLNSKKLKETWKQGNKIKTIWGKKLNRFLVNVAEKVRLLDGLFLNELKQDHAGTDRLL